MYSFATTRRVLYGETDQMGFLYYGNYGLYYEMGRNEAIRNLGISYKELEAMGIIMPVVELHAKYLRPAKYDDLITIKTTVLTLDEANKISFYCELFNEQNKLLNSSTTQLVFFDTQLKTTVAMPSILRNKLSPFFENDK